MMSKDTTLKYPPRRQDLTSDPGWRCWVDKWTDSDLKLVAKRFGSKVLFYEYFENGCTRFGCMPNTSITFPVAAMYIINFIKYCGKVNKVQKSKLKRKLHDEELQASKRVVVLKSFR
jgi:hypothetical protein